MSTQRKIYIDLIKSLAVIGVIVIHTSSSLVMFSSGSFRWSAAMIYRSVFGASVPLFLMCSGALLLDPQKDMSLKKLYFHSLLRIIIAMLFWTSAYKFYHLISDGNLSFSASVHALKEVILFNHEFHFYYLHMIIAVYVFLPITRKFVLSAKKSDLIYFIVVWTVFGILMPTVMTFYPFTLIVGLVPQWMINLTYSSVGYGILGYYLSVNKLSLKNGIIMTVAGSVATFFLTLIFSLKNGTFYEGFLSGVSPNVFITGVGIYSVCMNTANHMSNKIKDICKTLSSASFCIYLVHVFVIYLFAHIGFTYQTVNMALYVPAASLLNLLICLVLWRIIRCIPILNKYII